MEFNELRQKVVQNALDYGEQYNVVIDEDFSVLKLQEEVGELMQAILIQRRKSRPEKFLAEDAAKAEVAKELADVVGMAIVLGHTMDIDILEALKTKWVRAK